MRCEVLSTAMLLPELQRSQGWNEGDEVAVPYPPTVCFYVFPRRYPAICSTDLRHTATILLGDMQYCPKAMSGTDVAYAAVPGWEKQEAEEEGSGGRGREREGGGREGECEARARGEEGDGVGQAPRARRRHPAGSCAPVYGCTAAIYGCTAAIYGCTAAIYGCDAAA
eukprot:2415737-Rhodomonas_salina.2